MPLQVPLIPAQQKAAGMSTGALGAGKLLTICVFVKTSIIMQR